MRVFKNAWFERFARKEGITDGALCEAVRRAEQGQVDADLGGGVLKQRIARPGRGKSAGYRSILFFRREELALFVYGFAKSNRANLNEEERQEFRKAARHVMSLDEAQLQALAKAGNFVEVHCDGKEVSE